MLLQVTDYTYGDAYCLGLMSRYTGVFPGLNTQLAVYQRAPECPTVSLQCQPAAGCVRAHTRVPYGEFAISTHSWLCTSAHPSVPR